MCTGRTGVFCFIMIAYSRPHKGTRTNLRYSVLGSRYPLLLIISLSLFSSFYPSVPPIFFPWPVLILVLVPSPRIGAANACVGGFLFDIVLALGNCSRTSTIRPKNKSSSVAADTASCLHSPSPLWLQTSKRGILTSFYPRRFFSLKLKKKKKEGFAQVFPLGRSSCL